MISNYLLIYFYFVKNIKIILLNNIIELKKNFNEKNSFSSNHNILISPKKSAQFPKLAHFPNSIYQYIY